MSAITPQTELRLIKCPIESDNRNQLTFADATAQYNYFNSLPHLVVDNFTYQRKDSVIRYPAHIDTILEYNYVMYQNEAYTNKWFYAFITNMEYVNDNMTLISIHTDVYQTWLFNMVWKRSFIEREHVNSDNVGEHTIPEKLESGEYTLKGITAFNGMSDYCTVMGCTCDPLTGENNNGANYGKAFGGIVYYIFGGRTHAGTALEITSLQGAIRSLNEKGKIDSLVTLCVAPTSLVDFDNVEDEWTYVANYGCTYRIVYNGMNGDAPLGTLSVTKPTQIGSYTPKNKKVLVYPYNYFILSNNNGMESIFHYEDFSSNIQFEITGVLTPGCSIRAIPKNYKGQTSVYHEGINGPKLPICSWQNDIYTNWLTQNGINIGITTLNATETGIAKGTMQALGGAGLMAAGDLAGSSMLGIGINTIFNAVQQDYQHSLIPPQASGNTNGGDVSYTTGNSNFVAYKVQIREEYARVIDQYFSMFGYKVNTVKTPNLTGRTNWNYVKTIGANIEGDIPENHLNEIKNIFNNGVTLWHKTNYYLDYSQSNNIA